MEEAELTALLEDKRLEDDTAVRLLKLHNAAVPIADKKHSETVQVKIIENYFDVKDINWFLMNFNRQSDPVRQAFIPCMQKHI